MCVSGQPGLYVVCYRMTWVIILCVLSQPGLHSKILPQKVENKQTKPSKAKVLQGKPGSSEALNNGCACSQPWNSLFSRRPMWRQVPETFVPCLFSSKCHNKGWQSSLNNTFSFLTIGEVGKAKIRVLVDLVQ